MNSRVLTQLLEVFSGAYRGGGYLESFRWRERR